MEISYKHLNKGDLVWACAYKMNADTGRMELKSEPVYGIIVPIGCNHHRLGFSILNKNGTPRKSNVEISSRHYAATKSDCIEIYNALICDNIRKLAVKIHLMKNDILEVSDNEK